MKSKQEIEGKIKELGDIRQRLLRDVDRGFITARDASEVVTRIEQIRKNIEWLEWVIEK